MQLSCTVARKLATILFHHKIVFRLKKYEVFNIYYVPDPGQSFEETTVNESKSWPHMEMTFFWKLPVLKQANKQILQFQMVRVLRR